MCVFMIFPYIMRVYMSVCAHMRKNYKKIKKKIKNHL